MQPRTARSLEFGSAMILIQALLILLSSDLADGLVVPVAPAFHCAKRRVVFLLDRTVGGEVTRSLPPRATITSVTLE